MVMLDAEDSTLLDNKVPEYQPKPQEICLASSKQIPINKLDLDKVSEIQKLQAQGILPPLEESKVIDKRELKEQVRDMIICDEDSGDESSIMRHEEAKRQQRLLHSAGEQEEDSDNIHDPADYYSEDEEEDGQYPGDDDQ